MFSVNVIEDLLSRDRIIFEGLEELYVQLPETRCERKTMCCSLMPEMSLLEALYAIRNLCVMQPEKRLSLYKKVVKYFMLNPVEIIKCPFLEGDVCLIYQNRFFGCRSYGLWSKGYYTSISEQSRHVKRHIRAMWEKMDVRLPEEIIDFQVPYCTSVTPVVLKTIDDDKILSVAESLGSLSRRLSPWHDLFRQGYFSDLSFLMAALIFGVRESVSLKFAIVNDVVNKGTPSRLDEAINSVQDVFSRLTL